jgi:hypothetical protein
LRFILNLALMIGVALSFGFGLSWYALTDGRLFGTITIGPWVAWRDVGMPRPDPYTSAYIVRTGALELGASEGLQFTATADSDNRRLDRACTYRIDGTTPPARFWTLTAIDPETGRLATRPDGPTNLESARLARVDDGSIVIRVGTRLSPGNWLELEGDGPLAFVLTLYDASSLSGVGTSQTTLPAIIREGC